MRLQCCLRPWATSVALAILVAPPMNAQIVPEPAEGDVVLLGGRLFDGTGAEARDNPGLLVRSGSILYIGVDAEQARASDATVVEVGDGQTILPGFFDLHAHYAIDLFGEGRVDEYDVNPILFLANGVTSTFPGGEVDPEGMRRARLEIERGERTGPRIFSSGPYFGTARPGWRVEEMTSDSIRREVDLWVERGAKGFKAKGIQPDHLRALINAAHRHGLSVTGHLDSGVRTTVNPRDAILMGIDRIEHFFGGDAFGDDRSAYASLEGLDLLDSTTAGQMRDMFELYLATGTFFDATRTAYGYYADHQALDSEVYEKWTDEQRFLTPFARNTANDGVAERRPNGQFGRIYVTKARTLKAFYDAGGIDNITLGTDHPSWGEFLSPFSVHREMHAMVKAGLPNAAVLRIATLNGARALGVSDRLGTVEAGKNADLVVVQGDPLVDITATRLAVLVMKAGHTYDPNELFRASEGRMGPAGPDDAEWWKGNVRLGH